MRVVGLCEFILSAFQRIPPDLSVKAQERMRWVNGWNRLRERGLLCHGSSGGPRTGALQPVPVGQGIKGGRACGFSRQEPTTKESEASHVER